MSGGGGFLSAAAADDELLKDDVGGVGGHEDVAVVGEWRPIVVSSHNCDKGQCR